MPDPEAEAAAAAPPQRLAQRLPTETAGFRRGATLAEPQPGAVEVPYATSGQLAAGATVTLLPVAGAADEAAALEAMVADARQAAPHRRLRDVARFTLPAGGPARLRCAETEGTYGRERVEGLLCAGRSGATLVRLRVTMPRRDPPPADARAFAAGIAAALATGP